MSEVATTSGVESPADGEIGLTVAIVSDLHCHSRSADAGQESFLVVGQPRMPAGRHPIQALADLVTTQQWKADIVLCPGDVTNKACQAGLSQGVDYLFELERALQSSQLVCTLGNHDVQSRRKRGCSTDTMKFARTVHPDFPLLPHMADQYWAKGFAFVEVDSRALVVVLNTVIDHNDEKSAMRGSFADDRLDALDRALTQSFMHGSFPLRMAVLHHHPLLHSYINYTSEDVLANGDQLLDVLAKHRVDILVHGHKHQPRIRRHSSQGRSMIVFAAGSFSAFLRELAATTRNVFHLLAIRKRSYDSDFVATLTTWEYNHGYGWNPSGRKSAALPHVISFSGTEVSASPVNIRDFVLSHTPAKVTAAELLEKFPEVGLMLPDESEALGRSLEAEHSIRFVHDENGALYEVGRIFKEGLK